MLDVKEYIAEREGMNIASTYLHRNLRSIRKASTEGSAAVCLVFARATQAETAIVLLSTLQNRRSECASQNALTTQRYRADHFSCTMLYSAVCNKFPGWVLPIGIAGTPVVNQALLFAGRHLGPDSALLLDELQLHSYSLAHEVRRK